MDCAEVRDELDAYALGACELYEAELIERHLVECVECRSALLESQSVALAIALGVPLREAPRRLRRRVLAEAAGSQPATGGLRRRLLPLGVGALAAGAAAALVFAIVLQAQVDDLRSDNDRLAARASDASTRLTEQQQVIGVLAAEDTQSVTLLPTQPGDTAAAIYYWSRSSGTGALISRDMPDLKEGEAYHAWFLVDDESYWMGSFESWDGGGALGMDLEAIEERPQAVGVSIETVADVLEPSDFFLIAEFGQ